MSLGAKKPRLSGAQRRKLQKEKTLAARHTVDPSTVIPRVRVGRLDTVDEWRREISTVYREMRLGKIRSDEGTRLTYVANVGAQLAKIAQEIKELETLRQQLAQLQGGPVTYPVNGAEYLPAVGEDE
jgi:hypothetical protein